jgi:hypothetical protein
MKWVATIGLAAAVLALAVGAFALTSRGGGQSTPAIVTVTEPAPIGAVIPASTVKPSRPVSAARKPAQRVAHPTLARPCQGNGDESDPSGDDSSGVCRSGRSNNSSDNQAGDNRSGGD